MNTTLHRSGSGGGDEVTFAVIFDGVDDDEDMSGWT